MEIIAYGEDSLTLWALQNRFECILGQFNDRTPKDECIIFYRPSFGRKGGVTRSEFGEFDYIIISKQKVYLGETKWWGSPELKKSNELIQLEDNQVERHKVFKQYIEIMFDYKKGKNWIQYFEYIADKMSKPIPSSDSKLRKNLIYVLGKIENQFENKQKPEIIGVLLSINKRRDVVRENH